jgi:hypothetical protein
MFERLRGSVAGGLVTWKRSGPSEDQRKKESLQGKVEGMGGKE